MTNTTPTDADDRTSSTDDWNRDDFDRDRDDAIRSRESPERTAELASAIIDGEPGPDECTIYPREVSDEDLVTTWISAKEGSYVDLDAMR